MIAGLLSCSVCVDGYYMGWWVVGGGVCFLGLLPGN